MSALTTRPSDAEGLVDRHTPLVELKNRLDASGANLAQLSAALYKQKNAQIAANLYTQDRYCATGSDATAVICDPHHDQSRTCVSWCVNHYTGLNRHPEVLRAAQEATEQYGTGAGTSGMSGGMCDVHKQLESELARRVAKPAALLFPTGYTANLGALSALARSGDLILFDRESHASIIDGIKMSGAKWLPFRHNDVADLERKLAHHGSRYRDVLVVAESAYSMSGDFAPLADLVALKRRYQFRLYIDEAHAFGFYGQDGGGYCRQLGLSDDVDFVMSTLSKSTGSLGGFIACAEQYIPLLQWCANSYIFQACVSPADAAAALASLRLLRSPSPVVQRLHENNRYMRDALQAVGIDLKNSQSPVVPIYIDQPERLLRVNRRLYENGVFSVSVVYPAVKPSEGRIRLIVTARHSQQNIDYTVRQIVQCLASEG
ncbi:aminotransferase class I/II-fold pyridoxal phosphate-dependent enzyme [Candidatus Laterigemmans baculatus]|uniref:aminotransferase class I/II-fold pyridoxal phosphate-dependent enzyme n=1 Tax=Candidatus Laterigemmans baculatus TaxID=2770505 RepID=UPI0013D9C63A|nr:aminotransferase class I/II-fold pyridoxal phosphate-dependent enzyme [Candidatus Laterigemmans baculatus]